MVGWGEAGGCGEGNFKAVFHRDVAGGKINEEFRDEVRGDFFGALRKVRGFLRCRRINFRDSHIYRRQWMYCRLLRSCRYLSLNIRPNLIS